MLEDNVTHHVYHKYVFGFKIKIQMYFTIR